MRVRFSRKLFPLRIAEKNKQKYGLKMSLSTANEHQRCKHMVSNSSQHFFTVYFSSNMLRKCNEAEQDIQHLRGIWYSFSNLHGTWTYSLFNTFFPPLLLDCRAMTLIVENNNVKIQFLPKSNLKCSMFFKECLEP